MVEEVVIVIGDEAEMVAMALMPNNRRHRFQRKMSSFIDLSG